MAIDMAQQKCSNNKFYVSAFKYIYIYIYKLVEHKFYARVCAVGDSTALFLLLMDSSIKTSNIPTDQKGKKNIK